MVVQRAAMKELMSGKQLGTAKAAPKAMKMAVLLVVQLEVHLAAQTECLLADQLAASTVRSRADSKGFQSVDR